MWEQEVQGIKKFDDLEIVQHRLPIITRLETALVNAKPRNTLHFIKKWAQKQMNQLESSEEQTQMQEIIKERQKKKLAKQGINTRRRNAIVMAKVDQNQQWVQFINKEPLLKNEQSKSRIMICLREIPFLCNLGWDDINQLVNESELREYNYEDIFIGRGQLINRLYILLQGEVTKIDAQGKPTIIGEGSNMFMESIITLVQSAFNFKITSDKAWICGIESFRIYELAQEVSRKREEQFQKILMGVSFFNCLDKEQFYKLICLIKVLPLNRANDILLEKDTPIDKLFIVLKGEYLLCKQSLEGQITSFQTCREGQVFGENWLINPVESEFMVVAKTDGQIASISRQDLEASISSVQRLQLRKKAKRLYQSK